MADPKIIEAAKRYRAAGFNVIALKAHSPGTDRAKHPANNGWRDEVPTDEELYRDLRTSRCGGIGFPGGALNRGIGAIDIDMPAGLQWWVDRCKEAGTEQYAVERPCRPTAVRASFGRPVQMG